MSIQIEKLTGEWTLLSSDPTRTLRILKADDGVLLSVRSFEATDGAKNAASTRIPSAMSVHRCPLGCGIFLKASPDTSVEYDFL